MLSADHLDTLRNLADKKAGGDVGWVAIASARELTERGLAARTRNGWRITPTGEAALRREGPVARAAATVSAFHPTER